MVLCVEQLLILVDCGCDSTVEERFFTGQEEFKFRHVGHLALGGQCSQIIFRESG